MRLNISPKKLHEILVEPALLVIAFFTSIILAPLCQVPFSNPYHISNPYDQYTFDPANNYIQIICILLVTLGLFVLLRKLYGSKYSWVIKVLVIGILLSNHFIFNMMNIATSYPGKDIIYANGPGGLDNFHSGEQLAPGNALLNGSTPYGDMFFLRGAGVDAIVPALSFLIFGTSIGSFLIFTHILMLITMLGFFLLLWLVVKGTLRYVATIVLFYVSGALSLVELRDIPMWIILALVLYYFRSGISERHRKICLLAAGFLAALELYIAIDRGMLACVLVGLFAGSLLLFSPDRKDNYRFSPRLWNSRVRYPLYALAGMGAGIIVPALFLGLHSFTLFLRMTFVDIPAYGSLLVGTEFPPLFSNEYIIWGPIIICLAAGYTLYKLWTTKSSKDLNKLLPYTILFIFAVLCIKAGTNRIDVTKMRQVTAPIYFAGFIIICLAVQTAYRHRARRAALIAPIIFMLAAFAIFSQLNFSKIIQQPHYRRSNVRQYLAMTKLPDSYWESPETARVTDYLKAHTSSKDPIFVLPADPAYYYLADRPNPTRFFISWYADPQPYTNEMLADLKKNPPKVVVYQDKTWMNAPDGIDMTKRLPEVSSWLLKTYPKHVTIGNTILLEK